MKQAFQFGKIVERRNFINRKQEIERLHQNFLNRTQVNFLRMLLDGVTEGFTRREILDKYELGTSANVAKIIPQLEKKEIIETYGKKVSFSDPAFALWLKQLFS